MPTTTDFYAEGALNIARPPKEVLIERLNAVNGLQLNPDHFSLSNPTVEVGLNHNTAVWIMPVASSNWTTGVRVFYSRMVLSELLQHTAEVPTNGATNLYEIIDAVNGAYGIYLTESDVLDAVITYSTPGDATSNGTVLLRVRSTSVFFLGEITIPVNNSVAHGIGTYDEEMLHFVALAPHGSEGDRDTIRAYNELGEREANFNYLSNVTVIYSSIRQMWKRPNGTLIVLGAFTYDYTNELLETTRFDRKVLVLDRSGKASSGSSGNLYGVDYALLHYVPDLVNERVYVIDRGNEIGGNVHGLHAYNAQGAYDSTFIPVLSSRVYAVAPYEDMLYVVTQNGDNPPVLRRLLASGAVDEDFSPVLITFDGTREGVDIVRVVNVSAGTSGVTVVMKVESDPQATSWDAWSQTQQTDGIAAPIRLYDHTGISNAAVSAPRLLVTSNRSGAGVDESIVASNDEAVIYSANMINPTTGVHGIGIGAVQMDGTLSSACTQAVSDIYPAFADIKAIQPMARGDVMVAGNVQVEDGSGIEEAAAVFFFSYDGYFATQEVVIPGYGLLAASSHLFT